MELWPALRTQLPTDLWVYLAVLQVGTLAIFYGCYKSQRLTWPVFVFVMMIWNANFSTLEYISRH